MFENPADLLFLASICGVVLTAVGAGLLALPWKDDELAETTQAIRESWAWLDRRLQHVGQHAAHAVRATEPFDAHTSAFERPTASRAA